jgi:NAD(P)-dependent dehydrogenase (short-subunit alcohol dehydrogenase family)
VTGAGQGIGRAIATVLAQNGASVVLVDQNVETLEAASAAITDTGGSARFVGGSVSDRATADRAVGESVRAFGGVDIVVNCAHTFTPHASLETIPEQDFRTELDTGFFGTVHFMQAAFPHLRVRGGSVINFGSQAALQSDPKRATYASTKEAIRALSRTAARDWGKYKIRVNVICPMALTPAVQERVAPDVLEGVVATTALGYIGQPELDIAPVAVFLASEESHYVTGQTINADGGRWMF